MKAHITNLGLENFRVFKYKTHFEFAPITILTGTNSSGKSSLINALDILKNYAQTLRNGLLPKELIPPNTRNPFSSSKYLVNKDSNNETILFETSINIGNGYNIIPFNLELEFEVKEKEELTAIRIKGKNKVEILSIVLKESYASYKFFYNSFLDDLIRAFLIYYPVTESNDSAKFKVRMNDIISNDEIEAFKLKTKWVRIKPMDGKSSIDRGNSNSLSATEVEEIFNKEFFTLIPEIISEDLQYDLQFERLIIEGYTPNPRSSFLKPNIKPPIIFAPFYFKTTIDAGTNESYRILEINAEVENKISYLGLSQMMAAGNLEIESLTDIYEKFHNFISGILFEKIKDSLRSYRLISRYQSQPIHISPSHRVISADSPFGKILSHEIFERTTNAFVNKWLGVFNLGNSISIQFMEEVYGYKVGTDKFDNFVDLGYGMAKLIPLLFSMAGKIQQAYDPYIFHGTPHTPLVLLLEEPEANLHPALQSKLADMFVDAARTFNTQFIIETHSEYLIRKLQYLTAKGEIKPEDTAIYYFYPPDDVPPGEDQVKRIDIQEDGSLTDDFGTGFFDEADKIAMSIWNMNKSQKN